MSQAPRVSLHRQGAIGVVVLEDRESKNTFSREFVAELKRVFEEVALCSELKVVVVHGYETYFCCGGTKQELIELVDGARSNGQRGMSLDELMFYDLFLDCEVPVIAAMQGHAIGGGLSLGCFADVIVMAEEAIYSAVFMKYGFTPGMGSTYIIPKRLGCSLGTEMLLNARNYYGLELKQRGAQVHVVKRAEVLPTALKFAGELADKSRLALKLLKAHLVRPMRDELRQMVEGERAMHEQTFSQPDVRERIQRLFGS